MEIYNEMPEAAPAEILDGLAADVEEFFAVIEEIPGLDDELRAELYRKVEEVGDLITDVRKVISVSSENG